MLDRQYGGIVFECDSCQEVLKTGTCVFDDARAMMQHREWKAQKIGDVWIRACPNCEIDR
jgi:hypothetical protein